MASLTRRACASLFLVAVAIQSSAQPENGLAITNVTVIDPAEGRALPNMTVTVRDGAIASVVPAGPVSNGATRVNGNGKFVMPGLWDMHTHHQMTGEDSLPVFVAAGVTGSRDMGSDLDFILELRRRTASGEVLGPTIVAAGPMLDNRPPEWPFRVTVRTADEARAEVARLKARGVDFLKVHDATPPEAYLAIAEEARRQQLPFAGHLPRGITIDQAIEAGQRSLEHLASLRLFALCSNGGNYSAQACAPLFAKLAKARLWQTPTLVNWRKMFTLGSADGDAEKDHLAYASPGVLEFLAINRKMSNVTPQGVRDMVEASRTAAARVSDMQRAGVGILAGCDGMVAGFCIHDELAVMVEGGLSPAAALQTATINPARYLGREASYGSVTPGKRADLVLLDANPLENIMNVSRIHAVVLGGRLFDRERLDAMLRQAARNFANTPSAK